MTVTYNNISYECAEVVKHSSYVELLNSNGNRIVQIAVFNNDYSGFELSGGEWSAPEPSPQEQTDALMLDHEERLIYLELGVNDNAVSGS
jgi:hypothetical protein